MRLSYSSPALATNRQSCFVNDTTVRFRRNNQTRRRSRCRFFNFRLPFCNWGLFRWRLFRRCLLCSHSRRSALRHWWSTALNLSLRHRGWRTSFLLWWPLRFRNTRRFFRFLGTTGALDLLGSGTPAAGEALGTAAARALLGSGTPEDSVAAGEALGTTGVRDLLGSGTPDDSEAAAEVLGTAGTLASSLGADLLLLGTGTVLLGTVATDVVTTVVSRSARDAIDSEPATLSRSARYEGWSLSRTSGRSGTQTQCHEQGSDVPGGGPSGASGGGPSGGIGRRTASRIGWRFSRKLLPSSVGARTGFSTIKPGHLRSTPRVATTRSTNPLLLTHAVAQARATTQSRKRERQIARTLDVMHDAM